MLPARAATPPSARGRNQRGGRGRRGNHPPPGTGGQSSGPEPPICCRQSRYAAIPQGEIIRARAGRGDGSGEIIRARGRHLAGDVWPGNQGGRFLSRAAAGDVGPVSIPGRGRGDNHPGNSRRSCCRPEPLRRHLARGMYQRGGRGRRGNHPRPGTGGQSSGPEPPICCRQSRYAAICQGGNQRGGRGRRGNHPGQNGGKEIIRARAADMLPPEPLRRHPQGEIIPRRGRGDNHPGQSRYAAIWPGMYAVSAAFFPARAGDVGPVSRGDGGNHPSGRGRGDNHPGQNGGKEIIRARAATPPSGRGCMRYWPFYCRKGQNRKNSLR